MTASEHTPPPGWRLILEGEIVPKDVPVFYHSEVFPGWRSLSFGSSIRGRAWNRASWRPMAVVGTPDFAQADEGGVV